MPSKNVPVNERKARTIDDPVMQFIYLHLYINFVVVAYVKEEKEKG